MHFFIILAAFVLTIILSHILFPKIGGFLKGGMGHPYEKNCLGCTIEIIIFIGIIKLLEYIIL